MSKSGMNCDQLKKLIREVPDFPKKGILFYDITTLLKDKEGFHTLIDRLCDHFRDLLGAGRAADRDKGAAGRRGVRGVDRRVRGGRSRGAGGAAPGDCETHRPGGRAVSDIIGAGILPAAIEMMDALAIEAAEAAKPLMLPDATYEHDGFLRDVVFPSGHVDMGGGMIRVYYGAASSEATAVRSADTDAERR